MTLVPATASRLAEVGAPNIEIAGVDDAVVIAVGGQADASLAERIAPQNVSRRRRPRRCGCSRPARRQPIRRLLCKADLCSR